MHPLRVAVALFPVALATACAPDNDDDAQASGVDCTGACYVLATAVSSDDGATTYVRVMDHVETGELDLTSAREFPGWSDLKVLGDRVFVSSGEAPVVYRFRVSDDGQLVDDGEIGFSAYSSLADMYLQILVDDTHAFLVGDAGEYVAWNPSTLEITGTIPFPELEDREGLAIAPAYDRGMIVRDGVLFHAFAWADYANYNTSSTSAILTVDIATGAVLGVEDVPCPDLNVVSKAADGTLVFSNWVYSPADRWHGDGPATCMVSVPPTGTTVDPESVVTFQSLIGHEGAAVTALNDGDLLFSGFIEENTPFDPASDEMFGWIFGANWQSYRVDAATGESAVVEGVGWHSGGYYTATLAGTDYLLMPGDGYDTTQLLALGDDGATPVLHMTGWATRMFSVR